MKKRLNDGKVDKLGGKGDLLPQLDDDKSNRRHVETGVHGGIKILGGL